MAGQGLPLPGRHSKKVRLEMRSKFILDLTNRSAGNMGTPGPGQLGALLQMGMLQNAQQTAMQQMPGFPGYPSLMVSYFCQLRKRWMTSANVTAS